MGRIIVVGSVVLALTLSLSPTASGQRPYYAGRSLEILVGFPPGGATDLQARICAPFFQKYLPGNPRVTVRNMPGGGAILASNWFHTNAKPDGTTIFVSGGGPLIAHILGQKEATYNLLQWRLVSMIGGGAVFVFSPRAGIQRLQDLSTPKGPLVFGGISATGTDIAALLAFEMLRLPNLRVVMGFEGKGPSLQALVRGEITLDMQTTAGPYLANVLPLVKEQKLIPIMTLGILDEKGELGRDPTTPDLPTVYEAYQAMYGTKPDHLVSWRAYKSLLAASFSYRAGVWAPPNTAPEAMRALHEAIDKMNADPEFQDKGQVLVGPFKHVRGDLIEQSVIRSLSISPAVRTYVIDLLTSKYGVKF